MLQQACIAFYIPLCVNISALFDLIIKVYPSQDSLDSVVVDRTGLKTNFSAFPSHR